jgi:NADH pyrophosphatase NudC (nudix superfamily)
MPNGIAIKISTAQGESWIQIQGNSISVMSGNPSVGSSQQIQVQQTSHAPGFSMQPMQPMQPMKMGDMTMNLNPMEMKMGNMEMRMSSTPSGKRRFCSQCGASVKESDRFCSSCGNALN